jgi:hypothetical protein
MVERCSRHDSAAHGATVQPQRTKYLWKSGSFHPENVMKPAKRRAALES